MALARSSALATPSYPRTASLCGPPPTNLLRFTPANHRRAPVRPGARIVCGLGGRKQLTQQQGVNPAPSGPLAPLLDAPLRVKAPAIVFALWLALRILKAVTKRDAGSVSDLEGRGLVDEERGRRGKDPFYDDVMKNMNTVAFEELSPEQIEAARKRRSLERDSLIDLSKVELPDNHPWAVKQKVDPQEEELQKARLNVRRGAPLQDLGGNRGFPEDKFK